ncbi:MAG TPA: hypothetical protein PJ994_05455, partial [Tepidiformaceae bacterium]|nr:hypothetical protein [Tepidiformaceae bacterium]
PQWVRQQALLDYDLFATDPFHPSLQFKQVGRRDGVWSIRVGAHHRALAWRIGEEVVWFWIGTHAEYDQILRRL